MKKFISLILFIGLLGCLSLLIPKAVESIHDPGGGSGGGLTTVWLTVDRYNVMVGQSFTGTLKIITKENVVHPNVDYGDGESIWFIVDCDGSDLLGNPEADPLICEYDFTHNYLTAGTKTIKGGYSSQMIVEETITVLEQPTPDPGPSDDWNPVESKTIAELIEKISNLIFYLISSLAVLFVMIGGFYILTAAGNPEQINRGRKIILYTIVGFAVMAISRGIIALIYLILDINIP